MSASALIDRKGEDVTLTRYAAGAFADGTYAPGSATTSTIVMSVQPLKGSELLNLPEAQRVSKMLKGYAAVELYTAQNSPSKKADLITWQGSQYEVQAVEPWRASGSTMSPFWKVMLAGVNP